MNLLRAEQQHQAQSIDSASTVQQLPNLATVTMTSTTKRQQDEYNDNNHDSSQILVSYEGGGLTLNRQTERSEYEAANPATNTNNNSSILSARNQFKKHAN